MSSDYDAYLDDHVYFVMKAWDYLKKSIGLARLKSVFPELDEAVITVVDWHVTDHDRSKRSFVEYGPYDEHFYGQRKDLTSDTDYDRAWWHHIHCNDHHWQHWVLIRDEGELVPIDMPAYCIIEMVCDWWSFSFSAYMESRCEDIEDLYGIFGWYEDHSPKMILSDGTRKKVEDLLAAINESLEEKRKRGDEVER